MYEPVALGQGRRSIFRIGGGGGKSKENFKLLAHSACEVAC